MALAVFLRRVSSATILAAARSFGLKMKLLKPGRAQNGWAKEFVCTGKGNGFGGCGATLLVESDDIYETESHHFDDTSYYKTFSCICGVETDIDVPSNIGSGLKKRAWFANQKEKNAKLQVETIDTPPIGWRGIESAPTDDSVFRLWGPYLGNTVGKRWLESGDGPFWCIGIGKTRDATHWAPMDYPEPPYQVEPKKERPYVQSPFPFDSDIDRED